MTTNRRRSLTRTTEPTLPSKGWMTAGKSGAGMSIRAFEVAVHPERANKPQPRAGPKTRTHPRRRNPIKRGGCMADRQACLAIRSIVRNVQICPPTPGIAPQGPAVMLPGMDWQELAALSVVGITLALFLWARWAPRKGLRLLGSRGGGCGCSGGSSALGSAGLIVQGRRGERPQVILR